MINIGNLFKPKVVKYPREVPTGMIIFNDGGIKKVNLSEAKLICEASFYDREYGDSFLRDTDYEGWIFFFETMFGHYVRVKIGGSHNVRTVEMIDKKSLDELIYYYGNDDRFRMIDPDYSTDAEEV